MNGAVIDGALEDMRIIADTREHDTAAFRKRFAAVGCPVIRKALDFGDYSAETTVDGEVISLEKIAVIERKMSLDEIAGNFTKGRERFAREFTRAKNSNAVVWIVVEGASWENIYNGRYKSNFSPKSFAGSIFSWSAKYNLKPIFCKAETSGRIIYDILRYEMRKYLEEM